MCTNCVYINRKQQKLKIIRLHQKESTLISLAKNNNRKAQQGLYKLHAPKMLSVCRCYIKNNHDAEAVMVAGFFKVLTKINNYDNKGSFEGWIRKVMVNECISHLRKKNPLEVIEDVDNHHQVIDNYACNDLDVEDIQNAIDALPQGYRLVFNLFEIEGFKHKEIAAMMQISVNTSKTQLFKAKKMLQKMLQAQEKRTHGTA